MYAGWLYGKRPGRRITISRCRETFAFFPAGNGQETRTERKKIEVL
jgi:hypothetical protein